MSEQYIDIGLNDVLTVSSQTAERVISSRSCDAAMLLLYIMRNRGRMDPEVFMREYDFSEQRFGAAMDIIKGSAAVEKKDVPDSLVELPNYTAKELADAVGDPKYRFIRDMVEQAVGRPLYKYENNNLFTLYDYFRIPAEVMAILVNHLKHEAEALSSPEHPVLVSFADIRKNAVDWHKRGIVEAGVADAYVKDLEQLSANMRRCVVMMGIGGRKLTASEKRTLTKFIELDPSLALIELAYDATVYNTGALKWSYMSKILESWHEKGYKTPEDVNGDGHRRTSIEGGGTVSASRVEAGSEYEEQVLRFLKSRENGGTQ